MPETLPRASVQPAHDGAYTWGGTRVATDQDRALALSNLADDLVAVIDRVLLTDCRASRWQFGPYGTLDALRWRLVTVGLDCLIEARPELNQPMFTIPRERRTGRV